jgi:Restriction endonuclease NotI
MPKQPLAEVFGFPVSNQSPDAIRYREKRLCPFNNKVPNCTKDKANDPLGVCSVNEGDALAVTCPVRFREDWLIAEDAAAFFFPPDAKWTSLVEVRLKDRHGQSAGNVDVVLVSYDDRGKVTDFGSCEVQAVYISGNVRAPFEYFMEDQLNRSEMDWTGRPNYPRPDYLSSSRKRLAPQLLFKGGIFRAWGKSRRLRFTAASSTAFPG